jgi:hypothetical protein
VRALLPLTIGAGSIANMMIPEQGGSAMALFSLGPLHGPSMAFSSLWCPVGLFWYR